MTAGNLVGMVSVFFAGLLAGEEFVIRYGVRGPLASLEDGPHILFRQALIRQLRILVPSIYLAALLSAGVATAFDGFDSGLVLRCAGIVALVIWIAITLAGTVPINAAALEWNASSPPSAWRIQVDRWERLNTLRAWAAVAAFTLLLIGLTVTATSH